ncbi:MAG: hypothetical protein JO074_01835 [Frankiales bacterium]|nr:hypothetical protein [Frankiales bacterium]
MTMDPGSGAPMADRMQSLLSQAVEDQRSEQRQIAVALTEVRGQLARLSGELEALRSAPGGGSAGGSDEAVATLSRDVREAVRMLAERLDAVGRSVQERGADIAEMKVAVEDLHSAVRGHTNALAGVTQALAAVPAVGERVGGLQDNLVSLHERLAGLEEVAASVDRLGLRIESADQDMRELRSAFTGMASRMAELPSRSDLGAAGAQSTESLDLVAGRLARVESAIPELLARIDAVREHVLSVPAGDDAAPSGGVAAAEVAERLDAVEAALVVLTEQLTAEPDPAEAGAEAADDGPDPLAEQLADLHEGLFGEDGIAARLEGVAVDEDALNARIAAAVAESEQRVSAHMDEAVLALAEALFKSGRRSARVAAAPVAPPPAPFAPPPAPVPPVVVPEPVIEPEPVEDEEEYDEPEADVDDEVEADLDDDADDDAYEDEDEDEDDLDDEVDEAPEPKPAPAPPWQMPTRPAVAVDVPAPQEEPKPGRRRPWWRPGD